MVAQKSFKTTLTSPSKMASSEVLLSKLFKVPKKQGTDE